MLGEFITRALVLALGYAYPALECFRTVEKNRAENEELRFWCQYWIIVAVITVLERIGDIFVSWLPMYDEAKLALFIYLWYPKTKGTGYVYEAIFRPFVTNHETDIDRILQEFKVRAMDLAIYYWHNCTELGQTKFFEVLHYLASQSANIVRPNSERAQNQHPNASSPIPPPPRPPTAPSAPPAPPLPSRPSIPSTLFRRHKQSSSRAGQPPSPTSRRVVAQSPKAELVQVQLEGETAFVHFEDTTMLDENNGSGPNNRSEQSAVDQKPHLARFKIRRSKPHQ